MNTLSHHLHILFIAAALALGPGCGDQDDRYDDNLSTVGQPMAIGSTLVFVQGPRRQAILLDTSDEDSLREPDRVDLPVNPSLVAARSGDHDELLILTRGRRGTIKESQEPATLSAINAAGDLRTYELGNPFDVIEQSDDGRYAFLLKTGGTDRLLDNPNEVAIVDLEADTDEGVTLRTLRSFGDSPTRVFFSPEMRIVEETRRLAVIFSEANVTLIDLNHLDRRETTAPLSSNSGSDILPQQVLFDTESASLYIRGGASDDVFVFQLEPNLDNEGGNDFSPFINQLPAGQGPTDMALYTEEDSPRLLAVAADSQQAVVVEAGSSRVTTIDLEHAANRIMLFEGTSPASDTQQQRALLYEEGSNTVSFLDLANVEELRTRNLDTLRLDQTIMQVIPLPEENVAMLIHEGTGVSLLDLEGRTVTVIDAAQSLNDPIFDSVGRRLWVGPIGQPWLGFLDLESKNPGELLLDADISAVVPMLEAERMAIVHSAGIGYVTVVDADQPDRATTFSARGFLIEGILN